MSNKIMAGMSRGAAVPPMWTSVLAVTAHPDDASFGLGAVLDAFIFTGARIEVLCLTHGQAWTLDQAPGDLATLRGAGLASALDVLGPSSTTVRDHRDRLLGGPHNTQLATDVVTVADACHPDGLLVFDTSTLTGHLDHASATVVSLLAAETLGLPVLGWSLSEEVAEQLSQEFGACAIDPADPNRPNGANREEVDLRVTFDRARRRLASRKNSRQALPGSVQWRRLELLAETGSLRWLRPPSDGPVEVRRRSPNRSGSERQRPGPAPRQGRVVPGLPARTGRASS